MNVATLIKKANNYYCSYCLMRQKTLNNECIFCGNLFTNFEEILIENFKEQEN